MNAKYGTISDYHFSFTNLETFCLIALLSVRRIVNELYESKLFKYDDTIDDVLHLEMLRVNSVLSINGLV